MGDDNGGSMIIGPDNIQMFRYLQVAAALAVEINTTLRMSRGSVMNIAKAYCGSPKRTKRGVLADYVAWLQVERPGYEPNPSVRRALDSK